MKASGGLWNRTYEGSDKTDPCGGAVEEKKNHQRNQWIFNFRGIIFLSRSSLQYATKDICFTLHQLTKDKNKGANLYSMKVIAGGQDLPVIRFSLRDAG